MNGWMNRVMKQMNSSDHIAERKRAEMMERVSKALNSFSCSLKAISFISKFHAISLIKRHVAQENHFSLMLLSE